MAQESRIERLRRLHQSEADGRRVESGPVLWFPDPVLTEIARSARSALRASAIAIAVEANGDVVCRARVGEAAPDIGAVVQRDRGLTGECLSTGNVIGCDDVARDTRIDPEYSRRSGVRSIVIVPLLRGGRAIGVIEAFFPMRHGYDDAAVQQLEELAAQIVRGLEADKESPVSASGEAVPVQAVLAPAPDKADVELGTPETADSPASREQQEPQTAAALSDGADTPAASAELLAEPASPQPETRSRIPAAAVVLLAAIAVVAAGLVLASHSAATRRNSAPQVNASPTTAPATSAISETPTDRLRTRSEAGDPAAEFALAHVYRDGAGVAADPTEANRWLRRAAESGNPDAQLELAAVLEADKNIVDAYTWYVIAWQAGKTEAESAIRRLTPSLSAPEIAQVRYNVGKAYASGQALPRDAVSAYVWYSLADWGGDAKARDRLKELEQQLTPQQLGEAKSRAAAWIRRHTTRPNTTAPAVSSGP